MAGMVEEVHPGQCRNTVEQLLVPEEQILPKIDIKISDSFNLYKKDFYLYFVIYCSYMTY